MFLLISKEFQKKYILDRFTSRYDILLPMDGSVSDVTISLSEVPVKFVLPMYKKPTDKSLHLDFYKVISAKIYEHYKALDRFKRENLERSWRSELYKTLMRICKDRGYNSLQLSLADEGLRSEIFEEGENTQAFRHQAFDWLISRGEGWVTLIHKKGQITLSPDDFRCYFKDDWAKLASSLYMKNKITDKYKQIESDLRYMQDFIMDTLVFIFDLAKSAVNKKIILYPHNAYEGGYGVNSKYNIYLPPIDYDLTEWYFQIRNPRNIGLTLDLNDLDSVNKFVEMIPILLGNLLVRPAAFIVRDPDFEYLTNRQCKFAFDMSGSLLPSQMVGGVSGTDGPPTTGMEWTGGSESDYRISVFYLKWNEIISRYNTLKVHKLNDPNIFYEIVRRVLFTSIGDVAFYL